MSKTKKIIIALFLVIICIAAFLVIQIIIISTPTDGEKIADYKAPQKAVLVIDIQEDYTGKTARPPFPYKNSNELIDSVNKILKTAAGKNIHVIYIRQELDGLAGIILSNLFAGGTVIKGNPGTEIDERVNIVSGNIFPKNRSDAFSNPDFEEYLINNQINELFLTGLDADGCVHNTALGALSRGYIVNIISDAIALHEEDKWDALIKKFREEKIKLPSTRDFLNL